MPEATVCPRCAVGCSLGAGEGERARGVAGPVNHEGRLCPRGIRAFETLGGDDRLTHPLVRRDGELVAVDWETALDRAAVALDAVRDRRGADALAFLGAPHSTNEANYLLQKLARSLGTNSVDNRARECHASATSAIEGRFGRPASTNSLADLPAADVLLVVGANPADQQPIAFDSYVRPAVADGTTLVHVDPRETRTTDLADVHLAPRPGTDALVVTLLARLLRDGGHVDRSFVADRTTDVADYLDALDEVAVGPGAAAAGVDVDALREVAAAIGAAESTAVLVATGVDEGDPTETATVDALLDCLLLTGNVGRPGTGVHVLRGPTNEQGATDVGCRPDRLPGHRPVTDPDARSRFEGAWDVDLPADPGLDEEAAVAAFGSSIRGALVVGENPGVAKADREWLDDRLAALDALVVADLYPTETTAHADVVLPAAAGLETGGTVTTLDRRVQRRTPVRDPPGAARSDLAILGGMGERLVGEEFAPGDHEAVFREWTALSPIHEGLALADVGDGGVQWPVDGDGNGTGILYRDRFETGDGRAAFAAVDPPVPAADPTALSLVVGSRAGGVGEDGAVDTRLHLHAADAAARNLTDGDRVVVEGGGTTVTTTAAVTDRVREGTAALHASVADPLERSGVERVRVRAVGRSAEGAPSVDVESSGE